MAAEIAGALISSFIGIAIEKLASRQVRDFFRGREGNEELCEKLRVLLVFMDPMVAYAEQKQITDTSVRVWLNCIRDAVLDAEDLLDEIDVQLTQSKLDSESQTINGWTRRFFSRFSSFDNKIERMEKIVDRLEFLLKKRDLLQLKNASGADVASVVEREKRKSTSYPHESDNTMLGREDEKTTIIKSLTENGGKVSIISIVGMGGLGKTMLAQQVFNDPKVESEFPVRGWVCVSDDFNAKKLLEAILEAISKSAKSGESSEKQSVDEKLRKELTAKKFLLVLDDVWNEKREQWEDVKTPLSCGAPGSKILVTTRIRGVADLCTTWSDKIHDLKELPENYCWEVFVKHAFNNEKHQLNAEFENIGKEIVAKSKGLPLALKAMGSLLYGKSLSHWKTVLTSEIWQLREHKIMPALILSYHHLPSHLKRCFAFCALFPKDFNFDREELILLWMGENYLQCYNQNKSMEDVGKEYFDDLLSRSFFQQSSEDSKYYVMHDLLNDLAKYVWGDIWFTLEVEEALSIAEKTRHFSFLTDCISNLEGSKDLYKDSRFSRLRTFLPLNQDRWLVYDEYEEWSYGVPICDLLSKCMFLRVLSLCNNQELRKVPDSVGNLKHLRSLDLSGTRIKKLPNSTCSLFNLHILKLQSCKSLKELPPDLHKLRKLHHLDLRGTELRKLPMHLGQLKNLQVLMDSFRVRKGGEFKIQQLNLQVLMDSFRVGKGGEFKIQQLGELNIRGKLHISDMQNIADPSYALAANLESKMYLVELNLEWSKKHDVSEQEKEVLGNLRPSKHLEKLTIENYGGSGFPHWFGDDSLSSVVSLELNNCENCSSLPSLGQLPSLKKLSIIRLPRIEAIGEEFYGSTSCSSFASLETLIFLYMDEWKKWECKAVTGAFPMLQELSIHWCHKLEDPLPEQLLCLEKLTIDGCKELGKIGHSIGECMEVSSVDYYFPNPIQHSRNSLVHLSIEDCCESLTTFPLDFFPNLRSLWLRGCDNLQMISQDRPHNHLVQLDIHGCSQFKSFPDKGLSAPKLEFFSISEMENLKSLPKQMDTLLPSLIELKIDDCPEVEPLSDERLPSNLKELFLNKCSKIMASLKGALGANTSIGWLRIYGMDMESISDGHLPPNLKRLDLSKCSKLMASLKGALGANTSIERMEICGMDMESFPDEGFLPPSLTELHIFSCPNLKRLDYRGLCHLSSLTVHDCPEVESIFDEPLPSNLKTLALDNCSKLMASLKGAFGANTSIERMKINNMDMESFPDECLPSNLKELELSNCLKLMASLKGALGANTSIERMEIFDMDMESFPDEGFLPPSLTSLYIDMCEDLKRLDYRGLCHLSSLTDLTLLSCPSIQCLPEEGLPKSISSLIIGGDCELLKQRCQEPNGEDWGKIAHIQQLWIGSGDDKISQNKISRACNKVLEVVGRCSFTSCKGS